MNHDDDYVERRISDAFAAKAHAEVGDTRMPPPFAAPGSHPMLITHTTHRSAPGHRRLRFLAPLGAAAAVIAVVAGVLFGLPDSPAKHVPVAGGAAASSLASPPALPTSSPPVPVVTPVHVALKSSDGATYGVGMPIIAYLSKKITDGKAFAAATQVTVAGQPVKGAWYFEPSAAQKGYPIEAHYRLQGYWPAHSKITISLPVKDLSAGTGLAFDDSLSLDFSTGAANIATVNDTSHRLSLTTDGKPAGTFPVSLGAPSTPTAKGTKVIMEKGANICMSGPGYHECGVKWTQRLTYGGEYLHAAPWNVGNIGRIDSSNGCTNLTSADAQKLYNTLEIGDVVTFPNANGPAMTLGAGYGDWNVPWPQWLAGGSVPTS